MQLVEYAVITFIQRCRPDTITDHLVPEVALPTSPIGHLQVLCLNLGDDPAVCQDWVGGSRQRAVWRVWLTVLLGKDQGDLVIDAAA